MSMSTRMTYYINGLTIDVIHHLNNDSLNVSIGENGNAHLSRLELFHMPMHGIQIVDSRNQHRYILNQHSVTRIVEDSVRGRPRGTSFNTDVRLERSVRPRVSPGSTTGETIIPSFTGFHYVPLLGGGRSVTAPLHPLSDWINYRRNEFVEDIQRVDRQLDLELIPPPVRVGLSEEEIMSCLKPTKYCHADSGPECCSICQEEYVHEEDLNGLRCNHVFHLKCIKPWLMQKNFCPVCRSNVTQE